MKEKIILKSIFPEQYEDLEVECKVIENDYNVLEKGAFESIYTMEASKIKMLKRN